MPQEPKAPRIYFVRKPTKAEAYFFDGTGDGARGLCDWARERGLFAKILPEVCQVALNTDVTLVQVGTILVGALHWAVLEDGGLRTYLDTEFVPRFRRVEE